MSKVFFKEGNLLLKIPFAVLAVLAVLFALVVILALLIPIAVISTLAGLIGAGIGALVLLIVVPVVLIRKMLHKDSAN